MKIASIPLVALLALGGAARAARNPMLMHPEKANVKAPAQFKVQFHTTQGDFVVQVHRDWAPRGADRFYNLVKLGFYNDAAFFRVIPGFMAQFGINASPEVSAKWRDATILNDPSVGHTNARGTVTFAMTSLPNSRTTQLFINFGNNSNLDASGFIPFGTVAQGMEVVDRLYGGYGESPNQIRIQSEGNRYLKALFGNLDYIKTTTIVK